MASSIQLEVLNELGLHARPASEFVRCAQRFPTTQIRLHREGETYAATSILEVLTANLDQGATFLLEADGPDEAEALSKLSALMVAFREQEIRERRAS